MPRAGFVQRSAEIVGYLGERGIGVLGQGEVDREPGHAPVVGDQPSGELDRAERDPLHSREVGIRERRRALDQRLDDELVLGRLAVGEVGQGVDAGRPRGLPRRLGQLLERGERLPGEEGPLPGRDGDERRVV